MARAPMAVVIENPPTAGRTAARPKSCGRGLTTLPEGASIGVRLPAQVFAPLLLAGVALAVWTLSRFAADGFAANGGFPDANALLYATGIALIVLVPRGVGQHTSARSSDRRCPNSIRTPLQVTRPRNGFPLPARNRP